MQSRTITAKSLAESSIQDIISAARAQIEAKVGGKLDDSTAKKTSFEAIRTSLDSIPLEYLDSNKEITRNLFDILIKEDKLDFIEDFTIDSKEHTDFVLSKINELDRDQDMQKYMQYFSEYSRISERLLKINKIFSSEDIEVISEAIQVKPEVKTKIENIIKLSREAAASGFTRFTKQEIAALDSIEEIDDPEDREIKKERILDLFDSLGLGEYFKTQIKTRTKDSKSGEIKEPLTGSRIKRKNALRLIDALDFAKLPNISNSEIVFNGDYYRLFKKLESRNSAWLDQAINQYVIGSSNDARKSEFNARARNTESIYEEDQVTYLNVIRSWIIEYVKSERDGELTEKSETDIRSKLDIVTQNKEKEIKNYYLSRDFNLGNFGGIQLKPEIALPLYQKVELAVSEKDRLKESPLRNIFKSLGNLALSLASSIPYVENAEIARMASARNKAIFGALNALVKGGVTLIGGKQAAREYDKKIEKVFSSDDKKAVREEVSADLGTSGTSSPGETHQTPNSLTGSMDLFALAGPQRKTKHRSKSSQILNFNDFMQRLKK